MSILQLQRPSETVASALSNPVSKLGNNDFSPMIASLNSGSMWASANGNFWPTQETYKTLPPGLYRCAVSDQIGPFVKKVDLVTDQLIEFEDTRSRSILNEVKAFVALKPRFEQYGFLHKRGIMLYGPPGSGKTSTLQLLIKLVIEEVKGIVVFIDNPDIAADCLRVIRRLEPDRLILGVMEDLDALISRYGEADYLALLDGETQVNNILFLATTNYADKLDGRFTKRPSRFDTVERIPMPSDGARRQYMAAKMPELVGSDLDRVIKATEGLSIAHMREIVVLLGCFGHTVDGVLARMDRYRNAKLEATAKATGAGFLGAVKADSEVDEVFGSDGQTGESTCVPKARPELRDEPEYLTPGNGSDDSELVRDGVYIVQFESK